MGEAMQKMEETLKSSKKQNGNGKRKVTVLVMPQDVFLKVLEMDKERSLVIMETVNFGKKSPPISLQEMMTGKGMLNKWYGVVGRENYGIKPKYLYDMYKICESGGDDKQCKVVYVKTAKEMVSLNASTAMSLLMWAS